MDEDIEEIRQRKLEQLQQQQYAAQAQGAQQEHALDTLVREELGLDPNDLGSPAVAAASSFVMFAIGAAIPVLPFLFVHGTSAVALAAGLAFVVLSAVGGVVAFLSGTSPVRSAARTVGLAALAAGITHAVGRLFGAAVS